MVVRGVSKLLVARIQHSRRSPARYYGAPSSIAPAVTDGWTSGTPGRRMTGFETTEVMAGQFFNLTVLGGDLPSQRTAAGLRRYIASHRIAAPVVRCR